MNEEPHKVKTHSECSCHDRFNGVLGHYLGLSLIIAILSTLYLGVSGRAKDTALLPTLQTFGQLQMLVAGGMLAAWNIAKRDGNGTQPVPTKPSSDDGKD